MAHASCSRGPWYPGRGTPPGLRGSGAPLLEPCAGLGGRQGRGHAPTMGVGRWGRPAGSRPACGLRQSRSEGHAYAPLQHTPASSSARLLLLAGGPAGQPCLYLPVLLKVVMVACGGRARPGFAPQTTRARRDGCEVVRAGGASRALINCRNDKASLRWSPVLQGVGRPAQDSTAQRGDRY